MTNSHSKHADDITLLADNVDSLALGSNSASGKKKKNQKGDDDNNKNKKSNLGTDGDDDPITPGKVEGACGFLQAKGFGPMLRILNKKFGINRTEVFEYFQALFHGKGRFVKFLKEKPLVFWRITDKLWRHMGVSAMRLHCQN